MTAAILAILLGPRTISAEERARIARAVSIQGTVEWQQPGEAEWRPVKLNDTFAAGDTIRVLQRSRADLSLLDRTVLRLNENTTMTVQPVKGQSTGVIDLLRGAVHFFSRGPDSLAVNTPFTTAGVRGTEFLVEVESAIAYVTVFEGTVVASNDLGSVTLTDGQSAAAEAGKAPVLRVVARPRDAVRWALYYPPVLHFRPDEFQPGADWQGKMRASLDAYRQGDLKRAFEGIAEVPTDVSDPRFFTYRPHLLLAVGRAEEAAADIQRALALSPDNADALALQTVVAIVQNDKEQAFEVAQRAVRAAPTSAAAHLALSYAQQARFDLEGARASVQRAVALDPNNALAWARLAELHSSFGNLSLSLKAAEKAVALEPGLSRTQTVLGYSQLTLVNVPQAREAFEKAIALDSADPLPRLGLGLAKIRANDLAGGARDIESAASLDPNNGLIRSYLGKAYYEEKRTELKEREYEQAQKLDPLDPTPYFYSAIAKQTTNRPVEALRDLEKAIELNDNRAVYRSRLMLDTDLAARSASLARVYGDLGFQQLALVEGWKSVNTDPTNFSAHRFLADSYSVLPRHEIARVSEMLQAQLLQPLNMTPIQPSLAESNLFLVSSAGPGGLSFNEFNPIFNRDRVAVQPGGLFGSNGLYAGETVASGVYRNASISAGYSRFQTDGFRANADQQDDIANVFAQVELTGNTSVQAEYRHRESTYGDLQQRFFLGDFFPDMRNRSDRDTYRFGARQALSPESVMIASVLYQHADSRLTIDDLPDPGFSSIDARIPSENAFGAEIQHLLRSRWFNLRTGVGYARLRGEIETRIGGADVPQVTPANFYHANGYAYADVRVAFSMTLTAGASLDSLRGDLPTTSDFDQLNPKLGITWTPLRGTTIRAAAFRTAKRTLVTDQTIEPTEVAGFNQFFDDPNLTSAWRYGGAVDQKVTREIHVGAELSRRDLDVPLLLVDSNPGVAPRGIEVSAKEQLGRGYLTWAAHRSVALRAEYQFERVERDIRVAEGATKANTHRVPLGLALFHPSGLSGSATATFVHQDGEFGAYSLVPETIPVLHGSDQFWLFDLGVSYRLPKRYGSASLGATNLLDKHFTFFETDPKNVSIQPARTLFGRITLAFP